MDMHDYTLISHETSRLIWRTLSKALGVGCPELLSGGDTLGTVRRTRNGASCGAWGFPVMYDEELYESKNRTLGTNKCVSNSLDQKDIV